MINVKKMFSAFLPNSIHISGRDWADILLRDIFSFECLCVQVHQLRLAYILQLSHKYNSFHDVHIPSYHPFHGTDWIQIDPDRN